MPTTALVDLTLSGGDNVDVEKRVTGMRHKYFMVWCSIDIEIADDVMEVNENKEEQNERGKDKMLA